MSGNKKASKKFENLKSDESEYDSEVNDDVELDLPGKFVPR
jgi:hypothetical protein